MVDQQHLASPLRRLLALVIDVFLFYVVPVPVALLLGGIVLLYTLMRWGTADTERFLMAFSTALFVWVFGFCAMVWFYFYLLTKRGQSLGKMLVKIRVVDAAANNPGWGRALMREIVLKCGVPMVLGALIGWLVALAIGDHEYTEPIVGFGIIVGLFVWVIKDRYNQALHDRIAKTYVINAGLSSTDIS